MDEQLLLWLIIISACLFHLLLLAIIRPARNLPVAHDGGDGGGYGFFSYHDAGVYLEEIDDVQDSPWEPDEGSSPLSRARQYHLHELLNMGNTAFRENQMNKAIGFYSSANSIRPGDAITLSNRCVAYLRLSHSLKNSQPYASIYMRLSGTDQTDNARLALKDAENLMSLQSNLVAPYILKTNALILLERYELARDVIKSGLRIDPQSYSLRNLLRSIYHTFARRQLTEPRRIDVYDCPICLNLMYEPTTTPCGHAFCRPCLLRCIDIDNKCPLCRTTLFTSRTLCAVSVKLNDIIQRNFPEEHEERRLEYNSSLNVGLHLLPLFVLDVILPCQNFQLTVYEPCYRLMVRRVMEGNRHMGMTVTGSTMGSVANHACEVEITHCVTFPDGRLYLEIESRRRCRITGSFVQDGYHVAEVEWIEDICTPEGDERNELLVMTQRASEDASQWIMDAQVAAHGDKNRLEHLFKAARLRPPTTDLERFSFWLATLTNRRPSEKLKLLQITDTRERIRRGEFYMQDERRGWRYQVQERQENYSSVVDMYPF